MSHSLSYLPPQLSLPHPNSVLSPTHSSCSTLSHTHSPYPVPSSAPLTHPITPLPLIHQPTPHSFSSSITVHPLMPPPPSHPTPAPPTTPSPPHTLFSHHTLPTSFLLRGKRFLGVVHVRKVGIICQVAIKVFLCLLQIFVNFFSIYLPQPLPFPLPPSPFSY